MASFTGLPAKVVQRIFDSLHLADTHSLSLVTKSTFELAQPYIKERGERRWDHRVQRFYWEESCSFLVPIIHSDDSPWNVISRMTEFLEKVDRHPDIADYVKELRMPGPRYSCKPTESLNSFPTPVTGLIEAEITRCIEPQYLKCYLKDGWQDSKCLSTVLITATMLFLLPNVKTLVCSGGSTLDQSLGERNQLWGAETLYKLIKRLQVHKKPECKILQKLESVSIRWTTTTQTTFEFLEWLAALPNIESIQADGISTQVMQTPNKILFPRSSSLTKLEFHGRLHGTEALEGLLQAAKSLKSFVYHDSFEFEKDRTSDHSVGGREICSMLAKYSVNSLEKLRTDLVLSVESLSVFQRLTHLYAPLYTLPILGLPGEISTALASPPSLEHLILPRDHLGNEHGFPQELVMAVVTAKDLRWPNLKKLTLAFHRSDKAFRKSVEVATKDLAEVSVEFNCVEYGDDLLSGEFWGYPSDLF